MGDAADDAERRAWDEHDNPMPDYDDDGGVDEADAIPGMDLFVLRIRLGNDGMRGKGDISRALDRVASELRWDDGCSGRLVLDTNGNSVGSWALFNKAEDPRRLRMTEITALACSECGSSDLTAWYAQPERQTITVWRAGGSVKYDYTGGTQSLGDAGDDDQYQCLGCGRYTETIEEMVGEPAPALPQQWTFVWQTDEGPSLGASYPNEAAARTAAYEEWHGFQGGTLGGWTEGTREEFDAMYEESGDIWVVPLQAAGGWS